jgi:predicted extracellular nuclease
LNSCCNSGAALLGLLLISACTETGAPAKFTAGLCQADSTPITEIQGEAYYSPLDGSAVTVQGTVTHVIGGDGVYIEDTRQQNTGKSSRALFISDQSLSRSSGKGQLISVSGRVAELGSSRDKLTSLVDIKGAEVCSEHADLPLTPVNLPMGSRSRESLEGMRVALEQALSVTDVYKLRDGELTLSTGGVLRIPTEVSWPGRASSRLAAENRNRSLTARFAETSGTAVSLGSTVEDMTGLMGHDGRSQQLLLDSLPKHRSPAPAVLEPAAPGQVRMVSANLLNFFNGDGRGGGFPTERGAKNLDEFRARSHRLQSAMAHIRPDLLAVQELENDGFGPHSAARSLLDLLNDSGESDWGTVSPATGRMGDDVITVGLFYRQTVLQPVGTAHMLDTPEFQGLSRQPLAQLFRDRRSGVEFLVAVNHLKSKGSCPDSGINSNQDDGQGCWNQARTAAVGAQLGWLESLAEKRGTRNILVLGDMNAYRMEDPIQRFREGDFIDLVEQLSGLPQYTFLYWGQTGTLDYQFASTSMAGYAQAAQIWHVNASQARGMNLPEDWLRFSDHDPVIVDFDFSQSSTSN